MEKLARQSRIGITSSLAVMLLWVVSSWAQASEGIVDAAIFLCNPVRLTEQIVASCTKEYPTLRSRADAVLEKWLQRNRVDGKIIVATCRSSLENQTASKEEFAAMENWMKKREAEWLKIVVNEVTAKDKSGCDETLTKLDSGKEDLKQFVRVHTSHDAEKAPPTSLNRSVPPLVSVIGIISNPNVFNKRDVSFVAYLELAFEGNVLYLSPIDAKHAVTPNAIWLKDSKLCLQAGGQEKYVLVRGEFMADAGPRGLFAGTLGRVSSCDIWPRQLENTK